MRGRAAARMALAALALAGGARAVAADPYPRQRTVDAVHYAFRLELSDSTDAIDGELTLALRLLAADVRSVRLDLAGATAARAGHGMAVLGVTIDGAAVRWTHADDTLHLEFAAPPPAQHLARIVVRYRGIPATGLKIAPNRHGDRTFFSDNWPDKARHWLPTIDHVADKATSEFIVTAPAHYQVVSNGLVREVTDLPGGRRRTHWANTVPISPWLYVLGVARFAVQQVDTFEGKPIETWVYPQDRDAGFADFATPTKAALAFYSDYVGPFAYERLANIQSNSVSGGMEAATAILYSERAVTGTRSERWRNVVIHEIAHQWFGNAVTESDWDHVWLSEGFATYFTLLFIEHAYGRDEFLRGLAESRQSVLAYQALHPRATVIHDSLERMADVTSAQTYQQGSWTLHMLRGLVGDASFRQGIRAYYRAHRDGTATTADIQRAMEEASGQPLGWFFDQWLRRPGAPRLSGRWRWDAAARQLRLTLRQEQGGDRPFRLPMEVGVRLAGERAPRLLRIELREREQVITLDLPSAPEEVTLDPNRWVLMEATLTRAP